MNFAPVKIPLGGKSPSTNVHIIPGQETAKHCAKFGWLPLSDVGAVTTPSRETCWNLLWCPKLTNRSQPLVGWSSPYCEEMWRRFCSALFLSRPGSEGWSHHGRTFSIYLYPLSFWLTLPQRVLSMTWCCLSRPCVVFLACVHLALFLALFLYPDNSLVSSWCDHSMLASLLWQEEVLLFKFFSHCRYVP